VAGIKLAKLLT